MDKDTIVIESKGNTLVGAECEVSTSRYSDWSGYPRSSPSKKIETPFRREVDEGRRMSKTVLDIEYERKNVHPQ